MDLGQQTLSGQFLHPASNPYLAANIEAATRPQIEQLTQSLIPTLRTQAVGTGAAGGAREDLLLSNLIGGTQKNIMDVAAQMVAENYGRERGYQMQAPSMIQAGMGLQQAGPGLMAQVGDVQRAFEQERIDEAIRAFEEAQVAPWRPIMPYADIVQQMRSGETTNRVTRTPGPSTAASVLSGALGGGAMGAGIGSILWPEQQGGNAQMNAMMTALAGALMGGGAGAL
jgi:hypothetical protein